MPTQVFKDGTVQDVEAALLEEYGRTNVKQQSKTEARAEWSFQITSKSHGTCIATKTTDGVCLSMSPRTHVVLWVLMVVGYCACVVPGIFMTIWIIISRIVTSGVLGHRFSKMVDSVQRAIASHSSPVPPTVSN